MSTLADRLIKKEEKKKQYLKNIVVIKTSLTKKNRKK
jgi:hypothetical protein